MKPSAGSTGAALVWWRIPCVVAVLNVGLWFAIWRFGPTGNAYGAVQLALPAFTTLAQPFCWHSILTLNHVTQAVESLLWAAGLSWMAALLAIIAMDTQGVVHQLAVAGVLCAGAFVAYVLAVDVPMYLRRCRAARTGGVRYLDLAAGMRDAWGRREPNQSWEHWREDALWLTPYFSLGVWISLGLVLVPLVL